MMILMLMLAAMTAAAAAVYHATRRVYRLVKVNRGYTMIG